jgi:hypothetical protein
MKKPKNLGFEPVHPKNVLLASVVHGISCLLGVKLNCEVSLILGEKNILCMHPPTELIKKTNKKTINTKYPF